MKYHESLRMTLTNEQKREISQQRKESFSTKRTTVRGAEKHLYKAYPLLDHGFVRLIDYMGDDSVEG